MGTETRHDAGPFGGCPECGHDDGHLNVRRDHWFVCDTHRVRWHAGSNLFSDWRDESEQVWEENAQKLLGYRAADPVFAGDEETLGRIHEEDVAARHLEEDQVGRAIWEGG